MGPKDGAVPLSKLILRSYRWCSANLPAFDLLNTSAKLWYSSGMLFMLTMFSEMVVDWPVTLGWDPKLKTFGALKFAGVGVHSSIDEGDSWCFLGFYWGGGFCKFWDRVWRFRWGHHRRKHLDGGWAQGFVLRRLPERDASQYPVNRGIVVGEPVVS